MKFWGAALAASLLSGTAPAQAEVKFTRVALLLPACEQASVSAAELRSALALDLRDEHLVLAPPGELSASSDVLVSIDAPCDDTNRLALRAEYQGERHERRVDLTELAPAQRARALSLSLAELLALFEHPSEVAVETPGPEAAPTVSTPPVVLADDPAPEVAPKKAPPPPPPAKSPPEAARRDEDRPRAAASDVRRWEIAGAPELRFFRTNTLVGGRLFARYGGIMAGAAILTAGNSVAAGDVSLLTPHGFIGYAFRIHDDLNSKLDAGPRFGVGRTFINAEANGSNRALDAEDVYLDAAACIRYGFRLSRRWSTGLGVELGYAAGPIGYADGLEVARTAGIFAGLTAELTFQLGG